MLEYAQELFMRSAPNVTAWCDTLEAFLGNRNYKLKNRVRVTSHFDFQHELRHRFGRMVCGGDLEMPCSGMGRF
jgi:hypothetical protein